LEGNLFWVTVRKTREKSDMLLSSGLSERKVELREVHVLLF
jgi:hypothetical protein